MIALFSALVDLEVEMDHDTSSVFEEEAGREFLKYQGAKGWGDVGPMDFFTQVLGMSPSHPLIPMLRPLVATERLISRLDGELDTSPKLAALAAMWFYKCHECAQVYVRIPDIEATVKKGFWKFFRDISLTATDIFEEEKAGLFGKIHYRHFQRRTGVFVTQQLPVEYSPNVMFVFGGTADWPHDTARKLYISQTVEENSSNRQKRGFHVPK